MVTRRSSRLADWGNYGRCIAPTRDCGACPVLTAKLRPLDAFTDTIPVRLLTRATPSPGGYVWDEPWVMNRVDLGWGERGERWTWEELCRLAEWTPGHSYRDEHGNGFWLHRVALTTPGGAE